jgi:hypothetical protein
MKPVCLARSETRFEALIAPDVSVPFQICSDLVEVYRWLA